MNDARTARLDRRTFLAGAAASPALACAPAFAARPSFPATRALISGYVAAGKFPGAVVAVSRRGRPATHLAAGRYGPDGPSADPAMICRIYSMTKPVTGVAVMLCVEDGKLSLDQPIADLIPEFAAPRVLVSPTGAETRPAARPILVRHLITHTAGLSYSINGETGLPKMYADAGLVPGNPFPAQPGEPQRPADLDEFGARLAAMPLATDPGTRWEYSVGLDLAGLLVQRAAGKSFEAFLEERLFGPLGMVDTGFLAPASKLDRLATVAFVGADGIDLRLDAPTTSPFRNRQPFVSGGGGLLSTATDYMRFLIMLRNEGAGPGRSVRIMKPGTARAARSDLMPRGLTYNDGDGFGAGMEVIRKQVAGREPPGSYGWAGAAGTAAWVDPVNDLAVILMAQYMPSRAYPIWRELRTAIYSDIR